MTITLDLHNHIWNSIYPDRKFSLYDTEGLSSEQIASKIISNPRFAGAAVTMPLKVDLISIPGVLDHLTPSAIAIGAVNTIVIDHSTGLRVGTNTDTIGIKKSLLGHLGHSILPSFQANLYAGFIIGSGATTRSAIHALDQLNLSPIYLINRDHHETLSVMAQFPQLDLRPIMNEEDFEAERNGPYAKLIPIGMGCIPAETPKTDAEKMVYQIAHRFLLTPYVYKQTLENEFIRLPTKPLFLEMAYKPRRTPILIDAESAGWKTIEGIEPMIEQGLAQSRMWITGNPDLENELDPMTHHRILPEKIEADVRELIRGLGDL
ncbi:hypothetical protein CROQUDRAFT_671994 [Cronartium quercuum f. sp. fusiforme G11]|uniref:Shikimate dehydrogenase substrate binding N-terminal domain-containing protein n=1 Tax=Cronartium quercuum f. sp. fusiforme G11 TaxID=708437 RepID=A0A9P6NE45_9BASI|nr:hypothetical protein CROQUDRAFT_671994 [Cronartium quercuum f. sp. fusiforme G11]